MADIRTKYLNTNNINRSNGEIEFHPLVPFLPSNAKIIFLGSFPPQQKRWCMNFYYPNFINDHWRIEGEIWFNDRNFFIDMTSKSFDIQKITDFCIEKGIAFFDTATKIKRLTKNASDKNLEIIEQTDIKAIIEKIPQCRAIITTGEKATETICNYFDIPAIPSINECIDINAKNVDIQLYRLPSSSRAYPLSFEKKVESYKRMFEKYFE